MNRPPAQPANMPEPTIKLSEGWHCLHLYYQVDATACMQLDAEQRRLGREQVAAILDPNRDGAPIRLQTSVVPGHRADLGLMIMDTDPLKIDGIQQEIRETVLGPALIPTYSFVSISEVSEYVPTVEQYAEKLRLDGEDPADAKFQARVNAYEQRLPAMNKQRLYPEFPNFPTTCFYPMNKIRDPHANWFSLPFSERSRLMSEHATSGIKFAGLVSQLITASTGFDDWEWGVTLWARTPEQIKEIVYTMRFDEASARYAEFGEFYIGYIMSPMEALSHLKI